MTGPAFWFSPPVNPGLRARLLAPLGALQARLTARRLASRCGWHAPVPVICIASPGPGGEGLAASLEAVVAHVQRLGHLPAILLRGPAGASEPARAVDLRRHAARDVGSRALLAAAMAPTWIARDRAAGARAICACDGSADCIVMEGGFDTPEVMRDLSILVVDARLGFGNGHCFPAGPLREPVRTALARADLLISTGTRGAQQRFARLWGNDIDLPHLHGRVRPLETGMDWAGMRVLALAEIGQGGMVRAALQRLGAEVLACVPLERRGEGLSPKLLARLEHEAALRGAQLVTTERAAASLPQAYRHKLLVMPFRLRFEQTAPLDAALREVGLPRSG